MSEKGVGREWGGSDWARREGVRVRKVSCHTIGLQTCSYGRRIVKRKRCDARQNLE